MPGASEKCKNCGHTFYDHYYNALLAQYVCGWADGCPGWESP